MKRFLDIFISGVMLILLSPVMLILALLIHRNLGSPVFFRQIRPGRLEHPFTLIKFRSMRDTVDAYGFLLPDEKRLTGFGRLLRATSLDELPTLWNVFKGEMSLVGPRPLLMEYLPLYDDFQRRRHEMRPGVTGWAQVNGRNNISWERKFELDVWYVENYNFLLDLKILTMTALKIISRDGIAKEGHATTDKFAGNKHA